MRLSTLCFVVVVLAVMFTLMRDEVGRVGVIVFVTGLIMTVAGTAALLALFTTIGALGEARTLYHHVEALVATALVLAVGSSGMLGAMFLGAYFIELAIP